MNQPFSRLQRRIGYALKKLTISVLAFLVVFLPTASSFAQAQVVSDTTSDPASTSLDQTQSAPSTNDNTPVTLSATVGGSSSQTDSVTPLIPSSRSITAVGTHSLQSDYSASGNIDLTNDNSQYILNPAQLTPDTTNGSLNYQYPITIPPGRGSITPDIKLVYNNQTGEDVSQYGFGWSDNIPYIQRLNKIGANNFYGATTTYFYSSLTGELATTTNSSNYISKVDNGDFVKYTFSNNTWVATDKNGTQYTFGSTTSTRIDNPNNSAQIYQWMLEQIKDTNGNFVTYSYAKDAGQIYPSSITYTNSATSTGIYEIDFSKTSRTDVATSSRASFPIVDKYVINEIDIKTNGTWYHKYVLNYTTGNNGHRSLLSGVTETSRDEALASVTLPSTSFFYSTSTLGFTDTSNLYSPLALVNVGTSQWDHGVRYGDLNGDGQTDIFQAFSGEGSTSTVSYLNYGTGYTASTTWNSPIYFTHGVGGGATPEDSAVRVVDINGDGLPDIVQAFNADSPSSTSTVSYINNGSGFTASSTWNMPVYFTAPIGPTNEPVDNGIRFADINGDGLIDIIQAFNGTDHVWINNGHGFTQDDSWNLPANVSFVFTDGLGNYIDGGARLVDLNGDGLPDVIERKDDTYYGTTDSTYTHAYINNGHGWTEDAAWVPPLPTITTNDAARDSFVDVGTRFIDVNADGLPDVVEALESSGGSNTYHTYLNTGHGFGSDNPNYYLPLPVIQSAATPDIGVRIMDINGDGIDDVVQSLFNDSSNPGYATKFAYVNNTPEVDLLTGITTSKGSSEKIAYQPTPQYLNGTTTTNLQLPIVLQTVKTITTNDGLGTFATTTYFYSGGRYYYGDSLNRKIGGFQTITATDALGNVTKTYYHTGNGNDSAHGEYQDDFAKIGKAYRIEKNDTNGNLYEKTINKWNDYAIPNSAAKFVKLDQAVDYAYDGTVNHKDKAETYLFDNASGNQTQKIQYGQVTGSDDGTFTDTGTDDFTTNMAYASTTGSNVIGLLSDATTTDHTATKVSETRHYYDGLTLNNVGAGNETKTEKWVTGSTYINTQKTFNTYGLVTQDKDSNSNNTNYTYDSYFMYPATTTNALSQSTGTVYNFTLGKIKQINDPNGNVFQTIYDGFGRIEQENEPDPNTGSTTTKTSYLYMDTGVPTNVEKIDNLTATTSVLTYSYYDGYNRLIQDRKSAEAFNMFSAHDLTYNKLGLVSSESLQYFSTGASTTAATSTTALFSNYTYDALQRLGTTTNAVGTTTNTFNNWKQITIDALGKEKGLYKDAYNNLIQVDEHNSGSTYSTYYVYDGLQDLTKITDASGNIRNFTYDGLGRRLNAQDLHASADTTFGSTTYAYDSNGNVTYKLDPNNHTVNYTFDALNRPLTEDFTGQAGTEVSYGYDSCSLGIGHICSVTTTASVINYQYNQLGLEKQETKTLNSTNYTTNFNYDWQGNTTNMSYPDSSLVQYTFNKAGLIETVTRKESSDSGYSTVISNYDYNPLGQIMTINYGNGATTTNTYDANHLYRLSNKLTTTSSGGTGGSTSTIAYVKISGVNNQSGGTTQTLSVSSTAGNELVLFIGSSGPNVSSVSDGVNTWTKVVSEFVWNYGSDSVWTANNVVGGTHTITVTFASNSSYTEMIAQEYSGVKTSSSGAEVDQKVHSTGNNSSPEPGSLTTTSGSEIVVGQVWTGGSPTYTPASGFTKRSVTSVDPQGEDKTAATAGSYDANWTLNGSQFWGATAISLLPATSGGSGGTTNNIQNLAYTYDANGNITQIADTSSTNTYKTVAYAYDDLNRLASASTTNATTTPSYNQTYTYDAIGNITNKSDQGAYTYGGNTGSLYANPNAVTLITGSGSATTTSTIALDSVTTNTSTNISSLTYSKTVGTGSDRLLVVGASTYGPSSAARVISGVTYNGVALTKARSDDNNGSSGRSDVWYLVNPASGTHNVVFTFAGTEFNVDSYAASFTGVNQSGQPDNSNGNTTTGVTSHSVSLTTLSLNDLLIDALNGNNGPFTKDSSLTSLMDLSGSTGEGGYKLSTSTGSYAMKYTTGSNDDSAHSAAAFSPSTSVSSTTSSFTYDNNGNLLTTPTVTNTWDYRNQLASSTVASVVSSYGYDQDSSRVSYNNGSFTTYYPNQYYNLSSGTTTKNIYANGELVATLQGSGASTTVYYVHQDHLGGSNIMTNQNGTVTEVLDYYPYGDMRLDQTVGSFNQPKKFTGKDYDPSTGFDYFGARYYDAPLGKFTSQDPAFVAVGDQNQIKQDTHQTQQAYLADPQGLNSYSYTRDNPLRLVDPTGAWFGAFLTGQQSWSSFQGELGEAANQLSQSSSAWNTVLNHPYVAGAAIGITSAAGVAAAGTAEAVYGAYQTAATLAPTIGAISAAAQEGEDAGGSLVQANHEAGMLFEQTSGFIKNTTQIPSLSGTANYRIPDVLNEAGKTMGELKNVNYQSYTNQLKDFVQYSQQQGYRFTLYTNPNTTLSGPLQQVVQVGQIAHKVIGK